MDRFSSDQERYASYINRAIKTQGGHLHIGRGGFTLHFGRSRLSGYGSDPIKAMAIDAGLPVIDSTLAPIDLVAKLVVRGPMIALDCEPDHRPWHAYAYAPLVVVAAAYRRIGAEVFNVPDVDESLVSFAELPEGPLATIIENWLAYVQRAEV